MFFSPQVRGLSLGAMAKRPVCHPVVRRGFACLVHQQKGHGRTLRDLLSKIWVMKHNWPPIRLFTAKAIDVEGVNAKTSSSKIIFDA